MYMLGVYWILGGGVGWACVIVGIAAVVSTDFFGVSAFSNTFSFGGET